LISAAISLLALCICPGYQEIAMSKSCPAREKVRGF